MCNKSTVQSCPFHLRKWQQRRTPRQHAAKLLPGGGRWVPATGSPSGCCLGWDGVPLINNWFSWWCEPHSC